LRLPRDNKKEEENMSEYVPAKYVADRFGVDPRAVARNLRHLGLEAVRQELSGRGFLLYRKSEIDALPASWEEVAAMAHRKMGARPCSLGAGACPDAGAAARRAGGDPDRLKGRRHLRRRDGPEASRRSQSDFSVDLGRPLWSKDKAYWEERAPGVWEKLSLRPPGETLEVSSAPRKEVRYGTVRISRGEDGTWGAHVHFVTEWDSPENLTYALDLSPEAIQGVLPVTEYGEPGIEREGARGGAELSGTDAPHRQRGIPAHQGRPRRMEGA
jgi:hypothetical protein